MKSYGLINFVKNELQAEQMKIPPWSEVCLNVAVPVFKPNVIEV